MHRIYKSKNSKCGFTLTEMMIVVAIIIFIAAVVGVGMADLIKSANRSNTAVENSSTSLRKQINDSEDKLSEYNFG
jgi:prepilin-type N-terminal cleavage/methylation domain-containing protein